MICACSLLCCLVWFLVLFALVKIMPFFKRKLVDLIARNLGDPKGITGYLVMAALRKGNAAIEAITVKHLGVQPDHKVLEVGFGPGVGLEVALRNVEDGSGKVYGLEISEQMVNSARKRLKPAVERNKLEVHLGSVMALPFPDNFFDSVFHTNCYYFWPSIEQGVSELKRVLKPGGLMTTGLVYDALKDAQQRGFIKYGPNWHMETYMEKLSKGGFINVAMETIRKNPSSQACQVIFATKPVP